jgi:hypothetical protein
MTSKYGPFAAGAGFALSQDDYIDILGPMLQGDGVNTQYFGTSPLQVRGNSSGMQVLVAPGQGLIRGVFYSSDSDVTVTVPAASGSPRIDRVVLRLDRNHAGGGQVYPILIEGTPGGSAPALTRDIGGVWDIPLAQVRVGAGVGGINPEDVTDERLYLPLKVPVIDSRITSPYTVPAKMLYDKNPDPNIVGLWESNGTTWRRIKPYDSGWQYIGQQPEWIGMNGSHSLLAYRVLGNQVWWRADIAHDYGSNPDINVAPASLMPAWLASADGSRGDVHLELPVSAYSYNGGTPEAGWSLRFINESTNIRVRAVGPTPISGQRLKFCTSYLLD